MLFSWSPSKPWNDTALPKAWVFARVYSLLSARCSIRVGPCRKLLCVHKDVGLSTSNALSTLGTAEDIADREDARAGEASVPSVILCFLRRMVGRPGTMAEVLARELFPRPLDHVFICADSSVRPPMQVGYLVRDPCASKRPYRVIHTAGDGPCLARAPRVSAHPFLASAEVSST